MATCDNNKPRRIVDPRGHRIPLFVRLCEAFVDNLAQVLRVALVGGGIYLVHSLVDLKNAVDEVQDVPAPPPVVAPREKPPVEVDDLLDSEVIQLAEDCTRTEYWKRNYDKCFPEGSEIYPRPAPGELDDAGFIFGTQTVLYARLAVAESSP